MQGGGAKTRVGDEAAALRETLRQRDALLSLAANLAYELVRSDDPAATIQRALAGLGAATGVDRVYLFEKRIDVGDAPLLVDQRYEWVAAGVSAEIDNPDLQGLRIAEIFPALVSELVEGRATAVDTDQLGPRERAVVEPQGILSLLLVPIMLEGRFWGFLGFDSVRRRRRWTEVDESVLKMVAAALGAAMQRQRADLHLRRASRVLENTRDAIAITDLAGRILSVNPALCRGTGFSAEELVGRLGADLLSPGQATLQEEMALMLRQKGHWQGECRVCRKGEHGYPVWLSVSSIPDGQGRPSQYVAVATDIGPIKESEARLEFLAHHDTLTRLPNRRRSLEALAAAIARGGGARGGVAVLFIDLDRFKGVNDSLGHPAGDELLLQVVERLRARLRGEDLLARFGGDEFVVVIEHIGEAAEAMAIASDLCERLRAPFMLGGGEVYAGASIGVALYPDHADDAEGLVQRADVAMYRAKQSGRDRVCLYQDEMGDSVRGARQLESQVRRAMERDGLHLHYQPRIDLASGRVLGAEALLRVEDGAGGLLQPAQVIAMAEGIGLIVPIGRWALREACRQAHAWQIAGLPLVSIGVNVSARQFYADDLLDAVDAALRAHPLPPGTLEIELTESVLMDRPREAGEVLRELRARGVSLALDDFGSGYSSLSYLMRFAVDRLKIDHQFVANLPQDERASAIAGTIVDLAHRLDLRVVAEGVETVEQRTFLAALGVDEAQGFLFSRPLPAAEFEALLASRRPLAG